jgi:uncharacterized protein
MPTVEDAKKWYRDDDPVHGYNHILRVYKIAEQLAQLEGADLEIVLTAALLHDAEGPGVGDSRLGHQNASAEYAGDILAVEGWSDEKISAVQHCIRSHRFREPSEKPKTIEAKVLFDADKLDAIGAVGAVRAIAFAVLAGQDLWAEPSDHFVKTGKKEPGEAHTPYHEHIYKLRKLKDRLTTESGRAIAEGRHKFLEEFFEELLAELKSEK